MEIKAVAFDFGGVIETWTGKNFSEIASERLDVPVDDFKKAYFSHNHLTNVENRPWEEVFMNVVAQFSSDIRKQEEIRKAIHASREENKINTEVLELVGKLRARNLKVGILSNATSELRERLEKENISELFDEIVISSEIGFQKPSREAFEILFQRLGVRAQETIFVDDSPKSLESAQELGYLPVLFKSNEQLKRELSNLGVAP